MKFRILTLLLLFCFCTSVYSENPPYATVVSGPVLVGSNYEFRIRLDPSVLPDCGEFIHDCGSNGLGIDELDIHWSLYKLSDCTGCGDSEIAVTSGVINHGFWGTNCISGSTASGVDCATPGGCDNLLNVPTSILCGGSSYRLVAYALNATYNKGLAEGSSTLPGPYRCCLGNPSVGGLSGMSGCTLSSGGSGWLNPSYPQVFEFTTEGSVPAPSLSVTANISNNGTVSCGYGLSATPSISSTICNQDRLVYRVLLNGNVIVETEGDCATLPTMGSLSGVLIGCPDNPSCVVPSGYLLGVCGVNTLTWQIFQDCAGSAVDEEVVQFTLSCPDAGSISIPSGSLIFCSGESITATASGVVNPYSGGTYQWFYNTSSPYASPGTNYLGSGSSLTISNNGSLPYNTPISLVGSTWELYPSSFPSGCENTAVSPASFVFLSPLSVSVSANSCNFNSIQVTASGGLPGYTSGSVYTYDGSSAGAGTNTTGIFTGQTNGNPIVAGTYPIVVTDGEGCSATLSVSVYNPISISMTSGSCTHNSLSLTVSGGQPGAQNNYSAYGVSSSIDGFLGNLNSSGSFSASSGISPGVHQITVSYTHLNPNGTPSSTQCSESISVSVYDALSIALSGDACDFENQVVVSSVSGGAGPYTVYLSSTENGSANVSSTPSILSGGGTFSNVSTGSYYVVLQDSRGCKVSVPVSLYVNDFGISATTPLCEGNTVSVQTTGTTTGSWTYYLYFSGQTYPTEAPFLGPLSGSSINSTTWSGTFTNVPQGSYTVYATHPNVCDVLSASVSVVNDLSLQVVPNCGSTTLEAHAQNGVSPYTYTLTNASNVVVGTNSTGVFTGVSSGSYTVSVRDSSPQPVGGCTESVSVVQSSPLSFTATATAAGCGVGGTVSIGGLSGGVSPYTIYLSTTQNGSANVSSSPSSLSGNGSFTGVSSGSYYAVLLDGSGCYQSVGVTVGGSSGMGVLTQTNGSNCTYNNTISVTASGGTPGWTFYLYTSTGSFNVSNPTSVSNGWLATDAATGSGDVTASFINVASGSYMVYAVDASGCQSSPLGVQSYGGLLITAQPSASCTGGTVQVTAAGGGLSPYTIYLSTTNNGSANVSSSPSTLSGVGTFSQVSNGTYYVVMQDGNGCKISVQVQVNSQNGQATATAVQNCASNTIEVMGGNGSAPWDFYLYTSTGSFNASNPTSVSNGWLATDAATGSGDVSGIFSNVPAGTYVVYAVDNNDCVAPGVNVTSYGNLSLQAASSGSCSSPTVGVTSVSGGLSPYTIYLSTTSNGSANVSTTPNSLSGVGSFSAVPSGNYYVVLQDGRGCKVSVPVSVGGAASLSAVGSDCSQPNWVSVTASGGAPGWTFYLYTSTGSFNASNPTSVSNGWLATDAALNSSDVSGNFSNVPSGSYMVYALDASGCQASAVSVTSYSGLSIQALGSCQTGSVSVQSVSGGLSPYTIYLSTTQNGTANVGSSPSSLSGTGSFTGIANGSYYAVLQDSRGCKISVGVAVGQPAALQQVSGSCSNPVSGLVVAAGSSGWTLYLYTSGGTFDINNPGSAANGWLQTQSTGASGTGTFSNVASGNYVVYGVSSNGCPSSPLAVTYHPTTALSLQNATTSCDYGQIKLTASGGTSPYTYTLFQNGTSVGSNGSGQFANVGLGTYTATVTDSGGCTASIGNLQVTRTPIVLASPYNCALGFQVSGGVSPYLYSLYTATIVPQLVAQNGVGQFPNVPDGNYLLVVTDANNCQYTQLVNCQPPSCTLQVSGSPVCISGTNQYNVVLTLSGTGQYNITYGGTTLSNQSAGTITVGPFSNSNYGITVTSTAIPSCTKSVNGSYSCNTCNFQATASTSCLNTTSFSATISITGSSTYTITGGGLNMTNVQPGNTTVQFANGSYTVTVADASNPSCTQNLTISRSCGCDLQAGYTTSCLTESSFQLYLQLTGTGSYTVSNGSGTLPTAVGAGTHDLGVYPTSAPPTITVTSTTLPSCTQSITPTANCFVCNLQAGYTASCVGSDSLSVQLVLSGSGSYAVSQGSTLIGTYSAGTHAIGMYASGSPTVLTVTSTTLSSCTQALTINQPCFSCSLQAATSTVCLDDFTYNAVVSISQGQGSYTITDGIHAPISGVGAGQSVVLGPFQNGAHSVVVTSSSDATCTQTLTVNEDCYACDFEAVITPQCAGLSHYGLLVSIPQGAGSYVITDGIHAPTTVSAGSFVGIGLFSNGNYQLTITSVYDPSCSRTYSGSYDCFDCNLSVSRTMECLDFNQYNLVLTLTGSGTYSISYGNTVLSNQSAGTVTVGPFSTEDYSVVITSAIDTSCSQVLTGIRDCFSCALNPTVETICKSPSSYDVLLSFGGEGTYTIYEGNVAVAVGVPSGSYTFGSYTGNYQLIIISDMDASCQSILNGLEDCYDCELPVAAATQCVGVSGYTVSFSIVGAGTYTISDGVHPAVTGVSAGIYTTPVLTNGAYSIVITSEVDANCTTTLVGNRNCFACDLAVGASAVCVGESGYDLHVTLEGSGSFTLESGGIVLAGVSAGSYTMPGFENGAYTVHVTSELDSNCSLSAGGIKDCIEPFVCDLTAGASTSCIAASDSVYMVLLTVSSSSLFTIADGLHPPILHQSSGVFSLGPFSNGSYSVSVLSEENPECMLQLSGTQDCTQPEVCDPSASMETECVSLTKYNAIITLSGSGTYTISGGGLSLSNQSAGTIVLGPLPNGSHLITITKTDDAACSLQLAAEDDCYFDCDIDVSTQIDCIEGGGYYITVTIEGSGIYWIEETYRSILMTGLPAGAHVLGPFTGYYSIVVTNQQSDFCYQTISGYQVCENDHCDLYATVVPLYDETGGNGYQLQLTIEGTGIYNVNASWGVIGQDIGAGTYIIDMPDTIFDQYSIYISNMDYGLGLNCSQSFNGEWYYNCGLNVLDFDAVCDENGNYDILINFEGNGTYTIAAHSGSYYYTYENLSAGIYHLDNLLGSYYIVTISQNNQFPGPGCSQTFYGELDCHPTYPCTLEASITTECIDSSSYYAIVSITGDGIYNIMVDGQEVYTDVPAGDYIVGPYNNNEQHEAYLYNPTLGIGNDCFMTLNFANNCNNPNCDFQMSYTTECINENQLNITVTIVGTGIYDIRSSDNLVYNHVPAGSYIIVNPINNNIVNLYVDGYDEWGNYCSAKSLTGIGECLEHTSGCDLEATVAIVCGDSNSSFEIELTLTGNSVYIVQYYDGQNGLITENNVVAGTYTFTLVPLPNSEYSIHVSDVNDTNCYKQISGTYFCEATPICDLSLQPSISCLPDSSAYVLSVLVNGSGSYTLHANNGIMLTEISGGYVYSDTIANGGTYNISLADSLLENCSTSFSGAYTCQTAEACDLEFTVTPICSDTLGQYTLLVEITEGSDIYTLYSIEGTIIYGLTAGSYVLGPYTEPYYEVIIIMNESGGCFRTYSGYFNFNCDTPICNINADITYECIENLIVATLTLSGEGTYTIQNGITGEILTTDATMGSIIKDTIISSIFTNSYYTITSNNNPQCYTSLSGLYTCLPNFECYMNMDVELICHDDGSYNIEVTVTGIDNYDIKVETGSYSALELNVPAGTYNFDVPLSEIGASYYISAAPSNNGSCLLNNAGTINCVEQPPCDFVSSVDINCIGNGLYEAVLTITGSSIYTISDYHGETIPSASAGEYVFGPYPIEDLLYNISIVGTQLSNCSQSLSTTLDCFSICNLFATATPVCDPETDLYSLDINIQGSSTYTLLVNGSILSSTITAGHFITPPIASAHYNVILRDNNDSNCSVNLTGTETCDASPSCDLGTSYTVACINETQYNVILTVSGTPPFTIAANGNSQQLGQAGTVTLGPFESGSYSIVVTSTGFESCTDQIVGVKHCEQAQPCNVSGSVNSLVCLDDSRYEVNFAVSGTSTYTLSYGSTTLSGQPAGNYTAGPFENGTYLITVSDESTDNCYQTLSGIKNCLQATGCDLSVSASPECIGNTGTYSVTLSLSGSSSYVVSDGVHADVVLSAGEHTLSPFENGAYSITISDTQDAFCKLALTGNQLCEVIADCDLAATHTETCIGAGYYQVSLDLQGSSQYQITDGFNILFQHQTEGIISLPPISSGTQLYTLTDEANPECSLSFTSEFDCEEEEPLSAIGNFVFADINGNGLQDFGETGISDVLVTLYGLGDVVVATTLTDNNGQYWFSNIPAGTYYISVAILPNYLASPADRGDDDALDSDIGSDGATAWFTLPGSVLHTDLDAGMYANSVCNDLVVEMVPICPTSNNAGEFMLEMGIANGEPPYTIDASPYFTATVSASDFPLSPFGPLSSLFEYEVLVRDANGCSRQTHIGGIDINCTTVGIELLTFTGEVLTSGNQLRWVTLSETENDYFTLLRSTDGVSFTAIAEVDGAGTSHSEQLYAYLDKEAPSGLSYYRLDETDLLGVTQTAGILTLYRGESDFGIVEVVPIPVQGRAEIQVNSPISTPIVLSLYDVAGKLLREQKFEIASGLTAIPLDMTGYASGMYVVSLNNGMTTVQTKVVVAR